MRYPERCEWNAKHNIQAAEHNCPDFTFVAFTRRKSRLTNDSSQAELQCTFRAEASHFPVSSGSIFILFAGNKFGGFLLSTHARSDPSVFGASTGLAIFITERDSEPAIRKYVCHATFTNQTSNMLSRVLDISWPLHRKNKLSKRFSVRSGEEKSERGWIPSPSLTAELCGPAAPVRIADYVILRPAGLFLYTTTRTGIAEISILLHLGWYAVRHHSHVDKISSRV